jgi:hypothetical protein
MARQGWLDRFVPALFFALLLPGIAAAQEPAPVRVGLAADLGGRTPWIAQAFRARIAEDLVRAAQATGVRVDAEVMVAATRDDIFLALAPVADDECDLFGYLDLPPGPTGAPLVPPGYYLVDVTLDFPGARTGTAELVDSRGEVQARGLPMRVEEAPGGAPERTGLSLILEATELQAKRWKPDTAGGTSLHFVDVITIRF